MALCPYELGGTWADDRCLYQHLQPREGVERTGWTIISNDDDGGSSREEGCIRYSNLSRPMLPRALSRHDFFFEEEGWNECNEDAASAAGPVTTEDEVDERARR